MELRDKEVYFCEYCEKCKYSRFDEDKHPCDECLNIPKNDNSHKPIFYKEK